MPCGRMAKREPFTLALAFMFTTLITPGESLRCVQCISYHDRRCFSGQIAPEPCQETNSTSCVEYIATEDNKPTEFGNRNCHSGPETPGCKVITQYDKDYTVCTKYCYTDGCNHSVPISTQTFTLCLLLLSLLVQGPDE